MTMSSQSGGVAQENYLHRTAGLRHAEIRAAFELGGTEGVPDAKRHPTQPMIGAATPRGRQSQLLSSGPFGRARASARLAMYPDQAAGEPTTHRRMCLSRRSSRNQLRPRLFFPMADVREQRS